jgi:phosphoenolpyruvate carboxykinase (ATP)
MVWHPSKYAELLAQKMEEHSSRAWLVSTGWTGGPPGVGSRMKLKYTRSIIDAIHNGDLENIVTRADPIFKLAVPISCHGVPDALLNPRKTWNDVEAYDQQARKLANLFVANFEKYREGSSDAIINAGPVVG